MTGAVCRIILLVLTKHYVMQLDQCHLRSTPRTAELPGFAVNMPTPLRAMAGTS